MCKKIVMIEYSLIFGASPMRRAENFQGAAVVLLQYCHDAAFRQVLQGFRSVPVLPPCNFMFPFWHGLQVRRVVGRAISGIIKFGEISGSVFME